MRIRRLICAGLLLAGFGLGGCAQSPQQLSAASHGREYFPSSVYGPASRRVIADGQPVPHGGGQYLVGKPYTIAGRTYYPTESRTTQVGSASWYGDAFHGRLTANGEIYDRDSFTAASPTMPLPSYARVTNLRNNFSMIVRVNDRGPYASDRIMDVSRRVAEALDFKRYGTTRLKVEYVGRAGLDGSDDAKLYATLRTNGSDPQGREPTLVAQAAPPPRTHLASIAPYAPPPRLARGEPETWRMAPRQTASIAPVHRPSPDDRRFETEPRKRMARYESPSDPTPPRRQAIEPRPDRRTARGGPMPPSRPMDLGTIPGADTQIRAARRTPVHARVARTEDD